MLAGGGWVLAGGGCVLAGGGGTGAGSGGMFDGGGIVTGSLGGAPTGLAAGSPPCLRSVVVSIVVGCVSPTSPGAGDTAAPAPCGASVPAAASPLRDAPSPPLPIRRRRFAASCGAPAPPRAQP